MVSTCRIQATGFIQGTGCDGYTEYVQIDDTHASVGLPETCCWCIQMAVDGV